MTEILFWSAVVIALIAIAVREFRRAPIEPFDRELKAQDDAAMNSIRGALEQADREVSNRPRVPAGRPLPTINPSKGPL